ncbi:MAG: hypothetical protein ACK50Y_00945 [Flavobacteriia bacterium]|jgi:hypothetical protein
MKYNRFYSEVGKLLYSISSIDGKIDQNEKLTIHTIVENEFISKIHEKDQFGTLVGYYPEIELEFLEEELVDPADALDSFIDYINEHHTALKQNELEICRKVIHHVAQSSRGVNKKEKIVLNKVDNAIERINKTQTNRNHEKW